MASESEISDIPLLTMNAIAPHDSEKAGYEKWSSLMRSYLKGKDLWDVIEPNCEEILDGKIDYEIWKWKNMEALTAIQVSCGEDTVAIVQEMGSAKMAWDTLAELNQPKPLLCPPLINLGDLSKRQKPPVMGTDFPYSRNLIMYFDGDRKRFGPFLKAINKGDWDDIKTFIDSDSQVLTAKISREGKLPVHFAIMSGHARIAKKLVDLMEKEDLEIQDSYGSTVLHFAAATGSIKIVACLIRKNHNLVHIADLYGCLPVLTACIGGHTDTARCLYRSTRPSIFYPENGLHRFNLVCASIISGMLDIALDLLQHCPSLATGGGDAITTTLTVTPLLILSQTASLFPNASASRLVFWKRWIYSGIPIHLPPDELNDQNWQENFAIQEVYIDLPSDNVSQSSRNLMSRVFAQWRGLIPYLLKFSGIKQVYDVKFTNVYARQILKCMSRSIALSDRTEIPFYSVENALFEAIKNGNIEFVLEMIKSNQDLLGSRDLWGRNIIMSAIAYRQEKIFSLIYGLGARKFLCTKYSDTFGNNMLHLAGMPAPPSQLDRISGATLQMQRELQWFKEVESMMQPSDIVSKNGRGKTPRQIFTESHRELKIEGEKLMKETATSCTVVGALIITVMFTAAFSVPGGNIQDSGFPIFLHKKSFTVFIISDAISLFASSTSVLMFLGVLTSRYAEEDFLVSLPSKLIIGLSLLFISIAAMMMAFCAALILILNARLWIVIPTALLASVPVTLFIRLQFRPLVDIFMSTYGPSIFDKSMKPWYH